MIETTYLVPGEIAATRQKAERLRRDITAQLNALPNDGRLEVDLSGVTVMSGAFADELVGKLMTERPSDPSIVFVTSNERVLAKVSLVLNRTSSADPARSDRFHARFGLCAARMYDKV